MTLGGRWRLRAARGKLWLEPPVQLPSYSMDLKPGQTLDLPLPGWSVGLGVEGEWDATVCWSAAAPEGSILTVRSPLPEDRVFEDGAAIGLGPILAAGLRKHHLEKGAS